MTKITASVSISAGLLALVDQKRGMIPRSAFVSHILAERLGWHND